MREDKLQVREKRDFMSEKRLNSTIFLMYLVTENYRKKYGLSRQEYLQLD